MTGKATKVTELGNPGQNHNRKLELEENLNRDSTDRKTLKKKKNLEFDKRKILTPGKTKQDSSKRRNKQSVNGNGHSFPSFTLPTIPNSIHIFKTAKTGQTERSPETHLTKNRTYREECSFNRRISAEFERK